MVLENEDRSLRGHLEQLIQQIKNSYEILFTDNNTLSKQLTDELRIVEEFITKNASNTLSPGDCRSYIDLAGRIGTYIIVLTQTESIKGMYLDKQEETNKKFIELGIEHKKLLLFLFKLLLQRGELDISMIPNYICDFSLEDVPQKVSTLIQAYISPSAEVSIKEIEMQQKILQNITNVQELIAFKKKWDRLQNLYSIDSANANYFFNVLISNPISISLLEILKSNNIDLSLEQLTKLGELLSVADTAMALRNILDQLAQKSLLNSNNELFNKILNLQDITDFAQKLEDSADLQETVDFLLNDENTSSEVLFEKLLNDQTRKITQLDRALLYAMIPSLQEYLSDHRLVYDVLKSSLDTNSIRDVQVLFDALISWEIITTDNQLAPKIFDALIQQQKKDTGRSISEMITLIKPLEIFSTLHSLGIASDNNLSKLLTKIDHIKDIYNILNFFEQNNLINIRNAQVIFNQIIKLPDIANFVNEIIPLIAALIEHLMQSSPAGILQPQMLNILLKSSYEEQYQLINLWGFLSPPDLQNKHLELFNRYIKKLNDTFIDQDTKNNFEKLLGESKRVLFSVCKALLSIDIPVDFKLFSILINTPTEYLRQLNNQLSRNITLLQVVDSLSNFNGASVQFLAIYTKAMHQKLFQLCKQKIDVSIDANDLESAMRDRQVNAANIQFEKLHKQYNSKLEEYGGIDKVEEKIREKLLVAILQEQGGQSNDISNFINRHGVTNLAKCAANPNDALTAEMRKLFVSNAYPSPQVAWRAYDSGAKTINWPNLLTPNNSNNPIFSTAESRAGITRECNMATATEHVRTYAALAFLAMQDQPDAIREDMWQDFICYIFEIRRAHNWNDIGPDDPSCFPGAISRIAHILDKCPVFLALGNNKAEMVKNIVRDYINTKFKKLLGNLVIEEDKRTLYYSLIFMNDLDDIILNPDRIFIILPDDIDQLSPQQKQAIIKKYMQERARFFNELYSSINTDVMNALHRHNIYLSQEETDYLISACLVNISSLLSIRQEDIDKEGADDVRLQQSAPSHGDLQNIGEVTVGDLLQNTETTLELSDLPKPNETAKESSNQLFAIQDYWIPTLKLDIYAKLINILSNHAVCIAIINELFIGVTISLSNNPSNQPLKDLLITNLREKDINTIFNDLEIEGRIPKALSKQIDKSAIVSALKLVYDAYDPQNQGPMRTIPEDGLPPVQPANITRRNRLHISSVNIAPTVPADTSASTGMDNDSLPTLPPLPPNRSSRR